MAFLDVFDDPNALVGGDKNPGWKMDSEARRPANKPPQTGGFRY